MLNFKAPRGACMATAGNEPRHKRSGLKVVEEGMVEEDVEAMVEGMVEEGMVEEGMVEEVEGAKEVERVEGDSRQIAFKWERTCKRCEDS